MGRLPILARMDKRKLVETIVEISGMTRREAENAINAVSTALGIWAKGMIRDLPAETQGTCQLQGFGGWIVKYTRKGRRSAWREKAGIPQKPATLQIIFNPGHGIRQELKAANKPIREKYQAEYRPALETFKANRPPMEEGQRRRQGKETIRQSIIDEIAEISGKPGSSLHWHGQSPVVILPAAGPAPWDSHSETQEIIPEIMPAEDNRQNYPALSSMDKTQLKYFSEHPEEEKGDSADNPIDPEAQEEILKAQYKAGKLEGDPGAYLLKGTEDPPAREKELITTLREIRDTQDPEIYDDAIAAITPYIRQSAIPLADQGIESYDTLSAVEQQIKRIKAQKAANPIKSPYEPEFP